MMFWREEAPEKIYIDNFHKKIFEKKLEKDLRSALHLPSLEIKTDFNEYGIPDLSLKNNWREYDVLDDLYDYLQDMFTGCVEFSMGVEYSHVSWDITKLLLRKLYPLNMHVVDMHYIDFVSSFDILDR